MRQILPAVSINNKIVNYNSARISIFNAGFLYGHGIFTTLKVRAGCPLFLQRHLNRLEASNKQLDIQLPSYILDLTSDIKKAAHATIKKNNLRDGGIRITLTPATICIHAFTSDTQIQKISVITTPDTRDIYKTHKITYRIPHLLARGKARSQGAEDALFTQNNDLIESTTANIITYVNNDTFITPPIFEKGLNGITRQILIENLPILEAPVPTNTTNPLILVNSLGLWIVESIDGKKINQNPEFVNLIRQTIDKAEKNYIKNS
jgi:branched-subunit amino acid aminotransferase/4-amino-4-deoxychorismate lyase